MVEALSTTQAQPFASNYTFFPAESKASKVALQFFAALTFTIGCIALVKSAFATLFIALPCYVLSGALVWQIQREKDYDNPKTLSQYQEIAAHKPLHITIQEHGWENMMRYGIPEKSLFPQKFREAAAQLTTVEILDLYEGAARYCPSDLILPKPREFAETFKNETRGLTACEILDKFDADRLRKHGLVTEDLKAAKKEFEKIKQNRLNGLKHIQDDLRKKLNDPVMRKFRSTIRPAAGQNFTHLQTLNQLFKESAYLLRSTITHWFDDTLLIFNGDLGDSWGEFNWIPDAVMTFRSEAEAQRVHAEELIKALDRGYFNACDEINARIPNQ